MKFQKYHIPWNKEKHLSEETRKKIKETKRGKCSGSNNSFYGKHHSEKTKNHWSEIRKGKVSGNKDNHYKLSEITKEKMGEAKRGMKHPNWQGGKSFEPYSIDWTETLKRAIRERDNYICQLCSQYGNNVHHKDYDKKDCDPTNLITLCKRCNSRVNFNRNYWIRYFKSIKQ